MTLSRLKAADRHFTIYLGLFAAAWTGYVLLVYRHVQALGEDSFAYAAVNIGVRLALWVAPVFVVLWVFDHAGPARALGLVDNWRRGVLVGLGLSALLLAVALLRFGWPHVSARILTWNSVLSTSFGIGFFEEIPFRGFILQKLQTRMNFWLANAVTSVVFVGMHLPGWFMLHLFSLPLALNILAVSFVLGAVFRYSRSLWSCIISHSANDFISFVLFSGR
jgi:membrane protease YdiL (CAAX protease family)